METHCISDVSSLRDLVEKFDDCLFRGQNKRYHQDNDTVLFTTSFARKRCSPPDMIKWLHYGGRIFRRYYGLDENISIQGEKNFIYQAILQHYGWRSFYVDASESPAVSAWFAGKSYFSKKSAQIVEDCHEIAVINVDELAEYRDYDGIAYLYVLSRSKLMELDVGVHCLCGPSDDEFRYRFNAQAAWLLGPVKQGIPRESVIAEIEAPAEIFREYALSQGLDNTEGLFPNRQEDPCYNALMCMPKKLVSPPGFQIGFYVRALQVPVYDRPREKILSSALAFYDGKVIGDVAIDLDKKLENAHFITAPSYVMYGVRVEVEIKAPRLLEYIRENGDIAIEVDDLIRIHDWHVNEVYSKGLFVRRVDNSLLEVGDLLVSHPGTVMTAAWVNTGWFYRVTEGGVWERVQHEDECPCGNDLLHDHHMTVLMRVYADDSQIQALSVSCRHGEDQPNIRIEARPFAAMLDDLELAGVALQSAETMESHYEREREDEWVDTYRDLIRDEKAQRKALGNKMYEAYREMVRWSAQRALLGRSGVNIPVLGWMYGLPRGLPTGFDKTMWAGLVGDSKLRLQVGELPTPEPLPPGARRRAPLMKVGPKGVSREFELLAGTISHMPALVAVGECYLALPKPDANFVTDLQTDNFASRLFELYLFACFREQGLIVRQDHVSPDFEIEKDGAVCWIEAV